MWRPDLLQGALCYLDSNVLIYAFEGPAHARRRLAVLFDQLAEGRALACASVLVRAEVLVGPLRDGDARRADWYLRLLSGRGAIQLMTLGPGTADLAAKLRAERAALRLPDALHLAAASLAGCDYFITGDRRLAPAATGRLHILDIEEMKTAD
jgi:uncharacterized protein